MTFAITGGADAARFAIETELVAVRFISPPDFETPDSAAGTNLYELEVTVSDEGGLTDLQNITVTVTNVDEIPLITLLGDAVVNLEVDPGGTYSDAGATAWDPEDGDLSQAVEVGGQIVDLSLPGTYRITYDCEDLTGNAAVQVTRTVNVVAANAAPVFADQAFTLAENSSDGTVIGTLVATNADGTSPTQTSLVFWVDTGSVYRANRDGSNITQIHDASNGNFAWVETDSAAEHLYLRGSKDGTGGVWRMNFDGSDLTEILSGYAGGYGIAIDPANDTLYFGSHGTGIYTAQMDGSKRSSCPIPQADTIY